LPNEGSILLLTKGFDMSPEMWKRECELKQRQWDEMLAEMNDEEREHFLNGYEQAMRKTNNVVNIFRG
jgi:hypothetical protein